ncbi:MAG: hypothetical protein WDZ79_02340 [Candidatus Paceibacterota bacterium]
MERFNTQENNKEMESVLDCIMTAEEYSQIEHETPYIFELKAGDKELHYFGSYHSFNPEDALFSEIEQAFNKSNPDIVFVEGISSRGDVEKCTEKVKEGFREEIIAHMGESGFTLKLAAEKGVEWQSPEPPDKDLYDYLQEQGFSKDEIFAWEVFQILPQYNRQMDKQSFKEYVSRFIESFERNTNWEEFDYSCEYAIELGEQILGKKIDVEDEPNATDYIDPIPWEKKKDNQTVLNSISEAASRFRDRKIVSDLVEALKTHKKVFVVYGASHAAMQEPALKRLFEKI